VTYYDIIARAVGWTILAVFTPATVYVLWIAIKESLS
jgi:hypothetical protein